MASSDERYLHQLRDWHGRWADGGGNGGDANESLIEFMRTQLGTSAIDPARSDSHAVELPVEVAKKYSRINPYKRESGQTDAEFKSGRNYMKGLEEHLRAEGLDAFKNLPSLEVGESGKHAVITDGNHRIWAAAAIGMKTVPVNLITGEDDDWAKRYGFPVEQHVGNMFRRKGQAQ